MAAPSPQKDAVAPPAFLSLTDIASSAMGSKVLFATDEWFAVGANLFNPEPPIFNPEAFTPYGKEMDGWESRRKRIPGHDWCIAKLGVPGVIRGVEIDTRFFTGNQAPRASLFGAFAPNLDEEIAACEVDGQSASCNTGTIGSCATPQSIAAVDKVVSKYEWVELMPYTPLPPGYVGSSVTYAPVNPGTGEDGKPLRFTHIRLNLFPDGGVARLRVYGEVSKSVEELQKQVEVEGGVTDLLLADNGGAALCWTDQHYGIPKNLVLKPRAFNMANGWETARKPNRPAVLSEPGPDGTIANLEGMSDSVVLRLGARGVPVALEVDTNHFRGNFPESALVEVVDRPDLLALDVLEQCAVFSGPRAAELAWRPLLPRSKMRATEQRLFAVRTDSPEAQKPLGPGERAVLSDRTLCDVGPVTHVRLTIFPDGGVSRLRVFGRPVA